MQNTISIIKSEIISKAVAQLCKQANIKLDKLTYQAIYEAYIKEENSIAKELLAEILNNAKLANIKQRPLCQDTGMVVIFVEIGQDVHIVGDVLEDAINKGVKEAYLNNFFRKSVVSNPVFNRLNTSDNTPAVIYTNIVQGNKINLSVSIKGAGSENMSAVKMLKPADGEAAIIDFAVSSVKNAGAKACPPVRLGIGIGGTIEKAALLSKKALLEPINTESVLKSSNNEVNNLEYKILKEINKLNIGVAGVKGKTTAIGVNILVHPCHIASLPVAININCHSNRHASADIYEDKINYHLEEFNYEFIPIIEDDKGESLNCINSSDVEKIKSLKAGERILLSGKILTARDAAHEKLFNLIKENKPLHVDIKDKIIFYSGPCPATKDEIIGPTGPTTSLRMDKYTPLLLQNGLLATIGKGERSDDIRQACKDYESVYFVANSGVSVLLSNTIKQAKIVAYPELESEAIYELEVENFPVIVATDSKGNGLY